MNRKLLISLFAVSILLICTLVVGTSAGLSDTDTLVLGPFVKYPSNPILLPQGTGFESKAVFNPTVVVKDGTVYMLYRAENWEGKGWWNGTSCIGLAYSKDGVHFTRYSKNPVIKPEYTYEQPGGCEDPRVVAVNGLYYLTYTGYDGQTARLCLATSDDLIHWKKYGPIFPQKRWTKSGAILATKINGKYVMYFGDSNLWIAYSDDLIHWQAEDIPVMRPRPGFFDSKLVEPGPPPILTDDGILLIYNGADYQGKYSVGWVLFSKNDPTKIIRRAQEPLLEVTEPWEKTGQTYSVVFAEGLAEKDGVWYLYYGAADTYVAVATWKR